MYDASTPSASPAPGSQGASVAAVRAALAGRFAVVRAAGHDDRLVQSVHFWDGSPHVHPRDHALLLAVGVTRLRAVLEDLLRTGPSAIVLPAACETDEDDHRIAQDKGIALFRLRPNVDWLAAAGAVGALLQASPPSPGADAFADVPEGDLFGLANTLCRLIDAPVTIEDRSANVLAFSERQDEADRIRITSILRRSTPKDYYLTATDAELGAELPLYIPGRTMPDGEAARPRVVVAIPDNGRVLGTIWAVVRGRIDDRQSQHLMAAARVAARHIRCLEDRPFPAPRNAWVRECLDGSAKAAALLGVGWPALVVKVLIAPDRAEALRTLAGYMERAAWRERIASALTVHLEGLGLRCWSLISADTVYAVVTLGGLDDEGLGRACERFVDTVSRFRELAIGIGRPAGDGVALRRSREDADAAADTLQRRPPGQRVGCIGDLAVHALLTELRDSARADGRGPSGSLARLAAYDAARGTHLVRTLRAWLDSLGSVSGAAAQCGVHPNTFRYRLTRIGEVGGVDLDDPEARFALAFQLAMYDDEAEPPSAGRAIGRARRP